jgi:hypothetical protein
MADTEKKRIANELKLAAQRRRFPEPTQVDWAAVRKRHAQSVAQRKKKAQSKAAVARANTLVEQVVKKKKDLPAAIAAVDGTRAPTEKKKGKAPAKKPASKTSAKKGGTTAAAAAAAAVAATAATAAAAGAAVAPYGTLAVLVNPTLMCVLFGAESMAENKPDVVSGISAFMLRQMSEQHYSYDVVSRVCRGIKSSDPKKAEQLLVSFVSCLVSPISSLSKPPSNPYMVLANIPRPAPLPRVAAAEEEQEEEEEAKDKDEGDDEGDADYDGKESDDE